MDQTTTDEATFDSDLDIHPSPRSLRYLVLVFLIAGGIFAARRFMGFGGAMAGWSQNWDQSLDQSAQSGKPMLVLFTADWCPPCRTLKSDVLTNSEVASYLKREFTLCKVDLTDRSGPNNQTAATYGVRGVPTMIVFDAKGNQVDRVSGGVPKDYAMQWFQSVAAKAKR